MESLKDRVDGIEVRVDKLETKVNFHDKEIALIKNDLSYIKNNTDDIKLGLKDLKIQRDQDHFIEPAAKRDQLYGFVIGTLVAIVVGAVFSMLFPHLGH